MVGQLGASNGGYGDCGCATGSSRRHKPIAAHVHVHVGRHMLRTVERSKAGLVRGVRDKLVAAIEKPHIWALPRKASIAPLHALEKAEHRGGRPSKQPNVDVEKRGA